jgi:hypothetical protein
VVPKESNAEMLQQNDLNQTKNSAEEIPVSPPTKEKEPIKHTTKAMMTEIRKQMAHDIKGEIF